MGSCCGYVRLREACFEGSFGRRTRDDCVTLLLGLGARMCGTGGLGRVGVGVGKRGLLQAGLKDWNVRVSCVIIAPCGVDVGLD